MRWKKLRQLYLSSHPLCECCLEKGIIKPTEDIHHIKSFMSVDNKEERERLAFDEDNLMSLCRECHNEIHNRKKGK